MDLREYLEAQRAVPLVAGVPLVGATAQHSPMPAAQGRAPGNSPDPPTGAVPMRLGEQGQMIAGLRQTIAELEKRLASVLGEGPIRGSADASGAPTSNMCVSARIADHTRTLSEMCAVVVSMLERLEL